MRARGLAGFGIYCQSQTGQPFAVNDIYYLWDLRKEVTYFQKNIHINFQPSAIKPYILTTTLIAIVYGFEKKLSINMPNSTPCLPLRMNTITLSDLHYSASYIFYYK